MTHIPSRQCEPRGAYVTTFLGCTPRWKRPRICQHSVVVEGDRWTGRRIGTSRIFKNKDCYKNEYFSILSKMLYIFFIFNFFAIRLWVLCYLISLCNLLSGLLSLLWAWGDQQNFLCEQGKAQKKCNGVIFSFSSSLVCWSPRNFSHTAVYNQANITLYPYTRVDF